MVKTIAEEFKTEVKKSKKFSLMDSSCRTMFIKYPTTALEIAKKSRNKECSNSLLWSGFPVSEFSEKDVIKVKAKDKKICYTLNELKILSILKKFPKQIRTRKVSGQILQHSPFSPVPLSLLVKPNTCPDTISYPTDSLHMYFVTKKPVDDWKNYPIDTITLYHAYDPFWNLYGWNQYIYRLRYKKPIPLIKPTKIKWSDIQSIRCMSKIDHYGYKTLADESMIKDLKDWLGYQHFHFRQMEKWKDLDLKPSSSIKAYRGLILDFEQIPSTLFLHKKVGDKIILKSRGRPMSWSSNPCISKFFSIHDMTRSSYSYKTIPLTGGVLLSCTLKPSQILLDTQMLAVNQLLQIYTKGLQSEIITVPFSNDSQREEEFECTIQEMMIQEKDEYPTAGKYLPVTSFEQFFL